MEIMDPYTSELLSAAALPAAFSGRADAHHTDDYLRAIGALPRRSRAATAPASLDYLATLQPSSGMLPPSWDLFVSAKHAVEVSVSPRLPVSVPDSDAAASKNSAAKRTAAPVSDAAASKNSAAKRAAAPASDAAADAKNSAKRPRTCPWVPDYDADIDLNLREKERNAKQRPSPDYLKTVQGDRMDERTRTNLVVWMDEFVRHYRLAPGTLHRAVSYVDRVLSARTLSSDDYELELRLLGAAAVFTAAKYEDRRTILKLNAADIARYCGFATSKEVTDMEREMLATLRYELGGPTACSFVDHFTRHSRGEKNMEIRRLAHQLADTSLLDYGCLRFMPSAVAATALFLARLILDPEDSQEYFEDLTGYKPMELIHGVYSLFRTNSNSRFFIRHYRRTCRV